MPSLKQVRAGEAALEVKLQNASRTREQVEQLRQVVETLSDACSLSDLDRSAIASHQKRLSVYEEADFLLTVTHSLRSSVVATNGLQSAIERREQLIKLMEQDRMELNEQKSTLSDRDYDAKVEEMRSRWDSMSALLCELNADIVKGVKTWRTLFSQPVPFLVDGKNILLLLLETAWKWSHFAEEVRRAFHLENVTCVHPLGGGVPIRNRRSLVVQSDFSLSTVDGSANLNCLSTSSFQQRKNKKFVVKTQATRLLEEAATFPYSAVRPLNAEAPKDTNFENLPELEKIVVDEFRIQVELFRRTIECAKRGVYIPILQKVFEHAGPTTLPEHLRKGTLQNAIDCLRLHTHQYSTTERLEMGIFFLGEINLCVFDLPKKLPEHVQRCQQRMSTEMYFFLLLTVSFARSFFARWENLASSRKTKRTLCFTLVGLSSKALLRLRLAEWYRFVLLRRKRRNRIKLVNKIETVPDQDISPPSLTTEIATQTTGKRKPFLKVMYPLK